MTSFGFAWRSLTRQPARALLGVTGVSVVGALLFDMLLLSGGLAVSFRDLLDGLGFDVRVTANQWVPSRGPLIGDGAGVLAKLRGLREVQDVTLLRFGQAEVVLDDDPDFSANFMGIRGRARKSWTVIEGQDLPEQDDPSIPSILVNRSLADKARLSAGDLLRLRGTCEPGAAAMPTTDFRVAGIVAFRFEAAGHHDSVTGLDAFLRACEPRDPDAATLFLVASHAEAGPAATVRAIRQALPDLHAYTNQQFVDRMQVTDFSYFRQISFALSTITLFFAFLLIATLLTVSVNQRLGEVAALRALGFRRRRIIADLLWESALFVGAGGLVALPLGGLIAGRLDAILREMPGIPAGLHFFVFQPRVVAEYTVLLAVTGVLAAAYPIYLAARLPITATLRREVVS